MITAVSQVVWRCDRAGHTIDTTGWSDITGQKESEALGAGWLACVHPDDVEDAATSWGHAIESAVTYHSEFRIRTADGTYRWFRAQAMRVSDPETGMHEWIGVTWDVHERHVAEQSLRTQNVRLQAAIRTQQEIAQVGMDGIEIMRRVAEETRALLGADMAAVAVPVPPDFMEFPVLVGKVSVEAPFRTLRGESLAGWAFDHRQTVRSDDLARDSRVSKRIQMALGMRSSITVPLLFRDDLMGALSVSSAQIGFFDDDDSRTVELLAGILASALSNAAVFVERDRLLTQRTDALDQVRSSEELFRALTENAHELIMVLDATGAIRTVTKSAGHVLGYRPEELLGRHPMELVHPDDAPRAAEALVALAAPYGTAEVAIRMRHKDGSWRNIEGSGRNLFHLPAVNGIVTNSRDVTKRTKAERALRFQAHLLDVVQQAVIATDLAGNVTYWNKCAERMYGWTADETMGKNLRAFVVAPEAATSAMGIAQSVMLGETWTGEFPVRRRDGTEFMAHATTSPIRNDAGEVVGTVGISMDATERKLLEEQLRQAQKMDAVGQLAGGVAHDFNNILTAITSYSDMLLMDLAPGHPARSDVSEIRLAARRAAELTRQLLAFSRKQVMELVTFDATLVVGKMDGLLRRLIGENIVLETTCPTHPLPVRADRVHLEQVIMNLAVNSRDAMPEGGKLRITLATEEIRAHDSSELAPGPYLALRVLDTGVGMSADVRARVFEPFFTTKPLGKGTGLGLAVVYGIVKQFGGSITVTSEEGVGSEFTIHLPLARGAMRPISASQPAIVAGTESILLVEDNPTVALVARRVLERSGYRVTVAQSGAEAIAIVAANKADIDLVLTDVVMPEMSGPDLATRLLADGLEAPIVFMSGYAEDTVLRRAELPAGALYLEKPWTPSSLNQTIRAALDA